MAKDDLADLPEEVRAVIGPHMANNPETLASIGVAIAERRDAAKAARKSSGIEQIWKEAEEAYIGIDDANRAEFQDARWAKPMAMDGPVTTQRTPRNTEYKSTAYVRLTARYVDAGSAKLAEILLPTDGKAFSFSETPVPELIKAKNDTSQVVHEGLGVPLTRPAKPGEAVPGATPAPTATPDAGGAVPSPGVAAMAASLMGGAPPAPGATPVPGAPGAPAAPQVPLTVKDLAEENIELARKSAKAAETRVYDWLVECQHIAEMRKVIDDAARIGVGVVKGPIPVAKKGIAIEKKDDVIEVVIKKMIKPATRWADPWNIFPDPACGENIHNGDFMFDRDFLSPRQVRDLRNLPGYIGKQIDMVLLEGPSDKANTEESNNATTADGNPSSAMAKGRFEVWYYYGSLKREEMGAIWIAAGKKVDDLPADKAEVYAVVTMINDHVVKATINPLDSGSFPYHSVPWQRRAGHWAGIGVGEQIRMPQRMINAATRAMLNNAGKSAGTQIILDQGCVRPADGSWTITPDKIWYKQADSTGDVNDAFAVHEIPNVTEQLMRVIQYALQLAEESTSIPLITQGMSGETQPETLGATNIQNNNANQLLRSIGYAFDDHITEPVVRQFYEWLLLDPDVPDDEKGEFSINAHGSAALVERAIQDQTIAQLGPLTKDPAYGVSPKKWMKLFLQSKRLDPTQIQYTEEEQAKIDSTPPPQPPQVAAAQINQKTEFTKLAAKQTAEQQDRVSEERIAAAATELEGQKTLVQHVEHLHELRTRHELAVLDYANKHQMKVEDVQARLAEVGMKLNVQRELNATDHIVDLHKGMQEAKHAHSDVLAPPVQTPGRAANGKAFEQAGP